MKLKISDDYCPALIQDSKQTEAREAVKKYSSVHLHFQVTFSVVIFFNQCSSFIK